MENLYSKSLPGGAENPRDSLPTLHLENYNLVFYVIMTFRLSL